ncbi:MAG: ABC transporter permease, partial [Methylocystis sp.]|nr:ABC transporter permease [Methylocystis sp.]
MVDAAQSRPPQILRHSAEGGARMALSGDWTLVASRTLERAAESLVEQGARDRFVSIDLSAVSALDTAGAWLINRARQSLAQRGVGVVIERATAEQGALLEEAHFRQFDEPPRRKTNLLVDQLVMLGKAVVDGGREFYLGVAFLGEFFAAMAYVALHPKRFRLTSLVAHIELIGLRSAPIIILINLLVGGIIAQQGIFQLRRFGASDYAVNLIGILGLRELGVLLTSIMIAGRSGSAITAEIGSMKMREEIDALRVMGLSPIEVLIAPRVLGLVVSLPILTFLADMAVLFGGLCVSWVYEGISPAALLSLLK